MSKKSDVGRFDAKVSTDEYQISKEGQEFLKAFNKDFDEQKMKLSHIEAYDQYMLDSKNQRIAETLASKNDSTANNVTGADSPIFMNPRNAFKKFDYLWDEDKYLEEALNYCKSTYTEHYAGEDKIQFTEYVASNFDLGETLAAFKFNVGKYSMRYGKKSGHNRKDIMKAIHYLVMMLAVTDRRNKEED